LSKSNISNLIAEGEDDVVKAGVTSEGAEFLDSTLGDNVPIIIFIFVYYLYIYIVLLIMCLPSYHLYTTRNIVRKSEAFKKH
jgi:hypothetical protein